MNWRGFGRSQNRRRAPLAVVLSGGGNMGAFQAGAIAAIVRRGIVPDLIVGTSVGAINGAVWAFHQGPAAGVELHALWRRASARRVMAPSRVQLVRNIFSARTLFDQQRARRFLESQLPAGATFGEAGVPLAITVADAMTGERVVIRHGPVLEAVLASAAVPGAYHPVTVDGRLCFDGGVVANCDLETVVESGIKQALAIDLLGARPKLAPGGLMEILARSTNFSLRRQTDLIAERLRSSLDVSILRAALDGIVTLGDFSRTEELFALGERAAEAWLDRHLDGRGAVVPGLYEFRSALPERSAPAGTTSAISRSA